MGEISEEIKEYLILLRKKVGKVFVYSWSLANKKNDKDF